MATTENNDRLKKLKGYIANSNSNKPKTKSTEQDRLAPLKAQLATTQTATRHSFDTKDEEPLPLGVLQKTQKSPIHTPKWEVVYPTKQSEKLPTSQTLSDLQYMSAKSRGFKSRDEYEEDQEKKKQHQTSQDEGKELPAYSVDSADSTSLSSNRFPANISPATDVGNVANSDSLAGTLVQIQKLQSDIKKAEEDQKRVYKAANEKVAMLEYEMSILSPSSATESDFLNAEQKIEDAKKARDAIPGDYDKKISALQDEIFSLYGSLSDRYDFSEKSKYDSTRQKDENGNFVEPKKNIGANAFGQPVMFYGDGNTGYDDIDYDFINRDETARRRVLNDGISLEHDGYKNLERDEMTDDEIGVFNYLYSTAGPDAAYDFIDYITGELNARQRARFTEEQNAYAEKHPVGASVESIVTSPLKAVTAFNQLLDYADDKKIDQNAAYNRFSYLPTATRATVSDMIEKNWGPVGSFAYNVGMSMGDFLMNTAAGGGNSALAMAFMGSGAAADTVISAKDRGLSDDQALALGLTAAAVEALTEKISFGTLFQKIPLGKNAVLKYIGQNMLAEGGEEVTASLANLMADLLISQDQSEWNQKIQYYMSKDGGGLSENQAFSKAFWEQAASLGLDFLGGMASGGVLGGGSAAIQGAVNYASTPSTIRQMNKDIKHEATQRKLLDSLINASDDKKTNAAAKLVNTTAKYSGKGMNAVNATLEFIRSEASAVYNQIRAIDEAGTPSTLDKQESTQSKRTELQTRLDTLVATDEMIRRNREEIEAARKRKENVEYVDPGEFNADGAMSEEDVPDTNEDVLDADTANVNGETAQSDVETKNTESDSYNRYAQSAVKEALETAEVSVTAASRDLLRAYDGDMRAAVDALRLTEREIRNGNSRFTKSDINSLRAMDETLRRYNADFIAGAAENLRKSLAKYGVTNVVVGGTDFVGYKNVRNKANYNRDTGVLTVSPYLNTQEVIAASVAHEFTHHGAKYDLSLVNDAISLLNGSRDKLGLSSGELLYENYEATYREEAAGFMRSAKGQAVVKQYMDGGMSAAEAQAQVIKDYINEELAADFLGYLLSQDSNSRVFKTFSGENRTLLQRILDAITGFIRRLRGENADADVRQYERAAELLRDILNKGTGAETTVKETNANAGKKTETNAGAKMESGNVVYDSDGNPVASDEGNGSTRWSIDTYQKSGRETLVRYIQSRVDSGALSKADGDDIVDTMDRICKLCDSMTGEYKAFGEWSYASVEVDKDGNPVFSVIKPNGEYIMNLDFSLVCKKRRALDAVFNEMIRRGVMSNFSIGQEQIVKINNIIRKAGLEVSCDVCFVDAKRFRVSKVADDFVKMYNSLVKSMAKGNDVAYFNFGGDETIANVSGGIETMSDGDLDMSRIDEIIKKGDSTGKTTTVQYKIAKHLKENPSDRKLLSRGDFMSTRGFNMVMKLNPEVLSLYNSKKGSGGPKASFGDVQYLSDVIKSKKFDADKAYYVGGVRIQSFSDYVARLVFDYVQMVGDLAAKSLPAHAYTKELLFVKQFGLTGMKINMSLVPALGDGKYAGLNADGSYAWAKESFDYDAAMEIQSDPEYAKNCGTVAVGVSDQHIWKLLEDPNIRMVIPYHKSGINPVVAKMNKIIGYSNYTLDQNTRYKDGSKVSKEDLKNQPNFNDMLHNGMNPIEASRKYVEWCESKGYRPKFDRFVYNSDGTFNENYYKLLEDFTTMVDGVYHPQGAVKAVFPTEGSAFGSMEQLIREGLEQDAVDQFARDEKVGGIVDEVVAMLEGGDDIRHSKDVETPSERFQRQTKEQKAYLTRQLKSAGVEEWAKAIKPADRKKLAESIANDLPGVDTAYIDRKLGEIIAIAEAAKKKGETAEARSEAIRVKTREIALEIIDDSFAADPEGAEAKKLFDQITKAQIKLNSSLTADGENVFASEEEFKEWKKALPSFIKFSDKGKNVSEVYAELSEKFPEFLAYDPDLTDQKVMVERMADFMKEFGELYQGIQERYEDSFDDSKKGTVESLSERILLGIMETSKLTQKSVSDISITLLRSEIRNLERENKKTSKKVESLIRSEEKRNARAQLAADTKKLRTLLAEIYTATTSPVRKNFVTDSVRRDIAKALKVFEGEAYTTGRNPKLIDANLLDKILSDLKENDNGYVPMTQDKKGVEVGLDDSFLQTLTGSIESIKSTRNKIDDLNEVWEKKLSEAEHDRHKANINKKYGAQMTELQTEYVQSSNDFLKMLKHYIKESNDMFIDGKKTDTKTFSDKVIRDLNTRHGSREYGGKNGFTATTAFLVRRFLRKIGYESMNPTMFLELWGESGVELAATIREKETLQVTRSAEFVSFMQELLRNDYNIQAAQGIGNRRVTVEIEGKKIDVSKAQLMTLYALWQREQGRRHLENNGAVFLTALDNKAEYQSRTFAITEETFNTLMKKLSKDDIRIAEAVQEFLSTRCAEWGNEASVEMFGYSIFGEKHYFPIKVAEKVKIRDAKEYGAYAHYLNITNPGFAQRIKPDATGAIVIGDFFDVTANHVQQMASYSAYAPIANKVQHVLKNAEVREAIRFNLGEEGMKYFYDFLNLLNGVRKDGTSTAETYKWRYLFENMGKRSAVAFSLSTAAKQGTSLIRALPEINFKYVAEAEKEFALGLSATKHLNKGYEAVYDRMIANSGVARIKAMGFSDTGIRKTSMHEMYDKHYVRGGAGRELMISSTPTRAILKASDKFTEAGMWMAGKADEITWVTIYRACEIEAKQNNPGLSSEAQQKIAAKKFNHIIGMTQVVDSIMDTAPFQSSVVGTTLGVFMNEPIKTFGNLMVAIDGVKNGRKGAKQKLAAVVGSVFLSNVILTPLISAIFSGFRDDEDDSDQPFRKLLANWTGVDLTDTGDGTSWMSVMSSEMMRGFFDIVPAVGELYGMVLDVMEGYSSSSIGSQSIEDIIKSATNLLNYSSKKEEEKNIKTQLQMWFDFFKTISVPAGFPVKNILRDTKAFVNLFYHVSDNHKMKWELNKLRYNLDNGTARSQKNFYDIIGHVIREGDEDAYQYIREDLSNVFTSDRKGLSVNDMLTYMESRKVEFDYTSRLWNIELQANFDLPQFVSYMQVEPLITDVYRKTGDSSVLPSPPSDNFKVSAYADLGNKLKWNSEDDYNAKKEAEKKEYSRTVTFETQADLAEYTEKVGDYRYKTLLCFVNSDVYKNLNYDQKVYAINKAYDFAVAKYKTELYPDYDPNNDDFAKHIKWNSNPSQVAQMILSNARRYKKK